MIGNFHQLNVFYLANNTHRYSAKLEIFEGLNFLQKNSFIAIPEGTGRVHRE